MVFRGDWKAVLQRTEEELIALIQTPSVSIRTIDTPIPNNLCVQKRCCNKQQKEQLVMHAIQVKSTKTTTTNAPPLVLVHGYTAASMTFARNLVGLAEAFGTVYAVDLLGWGRSSRPSVSFSTTQETEAFFVESLHEWQREQRIESMILAGHSMGGYLSVAYAEQYPACVDRLLLMVPGGVQEQEEPKTSVSSVTLGSLWNSGVQLESLLRIMPHGKSIVDNVFGDYMSKEERRLMTEYIHANLMLSTPPVNKLFRVDSTAYQPLCHRIPKLREISSVSFIYAERDTWMKAEYGMDVQRRTTDFEVNVYMVNDAGHALHREFPDHFNAAVAVAAGKKISNRSLMPIVYGK